MGKVTAVFRQQGFRGRADDVALNSTSFTHALNTNWTQLVDVNFRVRFLVEETAGGAENVTWNLYYSLNGGAYAQVTTSTPVRVVDSTHFADDTATTTVLGGTGTFLAGYGDDADAVMPSAGNQGWTGSQHTEHELCLRINSAQVANNDTISLQVRKSGGTTITYNQTPTITVSEPLAYSLPADAGSYALTGTAAGTRLGRLITAGTSSYSISGTAAGLAYRLAPSPVGYGAVAEFALAEFAPPGYAIEAGGAITLAAEAGAYSVTGTAAALEHGREVAADSGAYAIAGTAATLAHGRELLAAAGAYAVTGTAAAIERGRSVSAEAGSYALTGTAAELEHGRVVAAAAGSYAVTGTDASLDVLADKTLAADPGSYAVTGTVAALEQGRQVTAEAGSYALSGTAAALEHGRAVDAGAGSYSITGTAAALERAWVVSADAGSYAVSGTDAALVYDAADKALIAEAGSYAITGASVGVLHGYAAIAEAGSYAVAGTDADAIHGSTLTAGAGSYTVAGTDATLEAARTIGAGAGSYAIAGTDATITVAGVGKTLTADAGSYAISGQTAGASLARILEAIAGSYIVVGVSADLNYAPLAPIEPRRSGIAGSTTLKAAVLNADPSYQQAQHRATEYSFGGRRFTANPRRRGAYD